MNTFYSETSVYRFRTPFSLELPCVDVMDPDTITPTAQDLLSDYKIVIKATYNYPASKIGVAFNYLDKNRFDYIYIE